MLRVNKTHRLRHRGDDHAGRGAGQVLSAGAGRAGAPAEITTVSKLLKQLAHADSLIDSFRGVNGGYRHSASAEAISVAEIVIAMEGPSA